MKRMFNILFLCLPVISFGKSYYVSTTGSNSNNGLSKSAPFQTIAKAARLLKAGDSLQLNGGQTHSGSYSGKVGITICPYGIGKATISSGSNTAITIENAANVTIADLIVKGVGYSTIAIDKSGINIINKSASTKSNITIKNVEVSGYGNAGILVQSTGSYGFDNVNITGSIVHDNGICGIWVMGTWDGTAFKFTHINVSITNCKAFSNHGRLDYTTNWSGSGILIQGTTGGLIDGCEAYENGKDNNNPSGGPIGIWVDDSKNVIIQNSISHHNKGGKTRQDGGGFDIDGGSQNCIIQNCDSYNNEGAGYGLYQWQTKNPWSNNIIRNNSSTNDGLNTKYGAFTIWGAGTSYKVTNAEIYGNRVVKESAVKCAVITWIGSSFSNIRIHDNSFCIKPPVIVSATPPSTISITNNSNPCVSVAKVAETSSFTVTPNPTTGEITIKADGTYDLQVINVAGRVVENEKINVAKRIYLSEKGVYIVLLKSGYEIKYRQIVVRQ